MSSYYMVCVIPLAQTVNRTAGCSPFRQLDCPGAASLGTKRHWGTENHRHLAAHDKPGLLCGKCATQIYRWTRILVLLNKGIR